MPGTILVGLTGGIGSGKSTVSGLLASIGAVIIDADAISRSLTLPGGSAMAAIADQFGPDLITPEGGLDRARMRELAYRDPLAKRRLEAIIHPLVSLATQDQAREATDQGRPCVVFDIPLLVESGHWRARLHRVIVVDCAEETQIGRVMARSGLSAAEVALIISAQASRTSRRAAADILIHNQNVSIDDLRAEVQQLAGPLGL